MHMHAYRKRGREGGRDHVARAHSWLTSNKRGREGPRSTRPQLANFEQLFTRNLCSFIFGIFFDCVMMMTRQLEVQETILLTAVSYS